MSGHFKLLIKSEAGALLVAITNKGIRFENDGTWIVDGPSLDEPLVDFVIRPRHQASSFDMTETYKGELIWDHSEMWWARDPDGSQIWWSAPEGFQDFYEPAPWPYPEIGSDGLEPGTGLEPDFEGSIHGAGGTAYSLHIDREIVVSEGILVRNDPQQGIGFVWSLLDPAKEIKPTTG